MSHLQPTPVPTVGQRLRDWRQRRRLSQLDFAMDAEISQKHLSFIETGRSVPSRAMVLRLARSLDVPLRERNVLLLAAGYAPAFPERSLVAPELAAARAAVERLIGAHDLYPALAVDRYWTMLCANEAVHRLLALARDPAQIREPVNVLRLSLHPDGLASRILNLAEWRRHLLDRLARQVETSADPRLADLRAELEAYPVEVGPGRDGEATGPAPVLVPLRIDAGDGVLSFISTTTIFGTPVDITLAEIAVEAFFPADDATASALGAARAGPRQVNP